MLPASGARCAARATSRARAPARDRRLRRSRCGDDRAAPRTAPPCAATTYPRRRKHSLNARSASDSASGRAVFSPWPSSTRSRSSANRLRAYLNCSGNASIARRSTAGRSDSSASAAAPRLRQLDAIAVIPQRRIDRESQPAPLHDSLRGHSPKSQRRCTESGRPPDRSASTRRMPRFSASRSRPSASTAPFRSTTRMLKRNASASAAPQVPPPSSGRRWCA